MSHQMTINQAESDFYQARQAQNPKIEAIHETRSEASTNLLQGVAQFLKKFTFDVEGNTYSPSVDTYLLQQSLKDVSQRQR